MRARISQEHRRGRSRDRPPTTAFKLCRLQTQHVLSFFRRLLASVLCRSSPTGRFILDGKFRSSGTVLCIVTCRHVDKQASRHVPESLRFHVTNPPKHETAHRQPHVLLVHRTNNAVSALPKQGALSSRSLNLRSSGNFSSSVSLSWRLLRGSDNSEARW